MMEKTIQTTSFEALTQVKEHSFALFNTSQAAVLVEQNDSQHLVQNIKKICTDSSSGETTPRRLQHGGGGMKTDVMDPAFQLPFKYGWKRELVSSVVKSVTGSLLMRGIILTL